MEDIRAQSFYQHMSFTGRKNVEDLIKSLKLSKDMKKIRGVMYSAIVLVGTVELYLNFKESINMVFIPLATLLGIEVVEKITASPIKKPEDIRKSIMASLKNHCFACDGKCDCDEEFKEYMLLKHKVKLF
ncbi:hypothetical protein [Clostridium folliculivorans]|uniref:Uncharacterized protein n=1 Tax=Clostridium folliculivorans TaxID=2886038 RepID=A0A9W6D905_9CLOT|nr:hypothetical protein [Clostridium folliculivorans]GKU23805.1 hypothetical protein CFOLD11_06310 [Clostridium folliculivorans]GKU29921.1 hypothetical protein CFB3_20280 [Clostridium folliculivorans]